MAWLLVLTGALACWLAYTAYRSFLLLRGGGPAARSHAHLLMGSQADVAEWFLRSVCLSEGFLSGRMDLAVEARGAGDDTAGIAEILARRGGFRLVGPGGLPDPEAEAAPSAWVFDVRGVNSMDLLKAPIRTMAAL